MSNNEMNSKKYFIFKFWEYTQRKHRVIQNKRSDSIILIFEECSEIFNEYYECKNDNIKSILKTSLEKMLDIIKFYSQNSPFIKYSPLNREFKYLISLIDDKDNKHRIESIYYSLISLQKKIENIDIIEMHIQIIQNNKLGFSEVDSLLDSIINELINKGYSLKYLGEWYKKDILESEYLQEMKTGNDSTIQQLLDVFMTLSTSEKKFSIIFYVSLNKEYIKKIRSKEFLKVGNGNKFNVCTDKEIEFFEENLLLNKLPQNYQSSNVIFLRIEKNSLDKYNAIQESYKALNKYLNLYTITNNYNEVIGNYCILSENNCNWSNHNIFDLAYNKLMKNLDIKEKKYIADLILLRDKLIDKNNNYKNIMVLERSLQVLINSGKYSTENALLNMWTVLELFVYEYNASSIIEKVRTIVSKAICLHVIKEKLNTLWTRIEEKKKHKDFNNPIIYEFMTKCGNAGLDKKYNIKGIISILSDDRQAKELCSAFNFNINIQRDIAEINYLLQNKNIGKNENGGTATKKYIEGLQETILHDIDRIYRVRNKITHHGDDLHENLETVVERLFRYVNSLINVFIYHIKEKPELTIPEILYSIVNSYNWYIDFLNKNDSNDMEKIIEPPKLFL